MTFDGVCREFMSDKLLFTTAVDAEAKAVLTAKNTGACVCKALLSAKSEASLNNVQNKPQTRNKAHRQHGCVLQVEQMRAVEDDGGQT